jgi:hypothetical protein
MGDSSYSALLNIRAEFYWPSAPTCGRIRKSGNLTSGLTMLGCPPKSSTARKLFRPQILTKCRCDFPGPGAGGRIGKFAGLRRKRHRTWPSMRWGSFEFGRQEFVDFPPRQV